MKKQMFFVGMLLSVAGNMKAPIERDMTQEYPAERAAAAEQKPESVPVRDDYQNETAESDYWNETTPLVTEEQQHEYDYDSDYESDEHELENETMAELKTELLDVAHAMMMKARNAADVLRNKVQIVQEQLSEKGKKTSKQLVTLKADLKKAAKEEHQTWMQWVDLAGKAKKKSKGWQSERSSEENPRQLYNKTQTEPGSFTNDKTFRRLEGKNK